MDIPMQLAFLPAFLINVEMMSAITSDKSQIEQCKIVLENLLGSGS